MFGDALVELNQNTNQEREGAEPSGRILGLKYAQVLFLLAALLIITATVFFRIPMLHFFGFYEPDGYFHYSVVRSAINSNSLVPPQYLGISGWPNLTPRTPHHEPFGLYLVTLIPYAFLRYVGMGYYDIMRLIPVVYGVVSVICAYLLSRYLNKDKFFGLLVMLFVALSMGNAARTSALIYRGDSFVTVFLLAALILTVEMFKNKNRDLKIIYMLGAGLMLSLTNLVWNGAAFVTAIYIFAFMLMLILGFTFEKKELVKDSKYMLGALAFWFVLVNMLRAVQLIVSIQAFTGWHFLILYVIMILSWYLAHRFTSRRPSFPLLNSAYARFAVCVLVIAVAFVFIYIIMPNFVNDIFFTSGFLITDSFSSTIQEMQSPSFAFLFASFGLQNFMTPMSMIMAVATFPGIDYVILFWSILMLCFIPYFFMHVEKDGEGLLSGNSKWHFAFDESLLILISYLALTAYLQMHGIRFNSLVSVPIAMFSAYTIYWLICSSKKNAASFAVLFGMLAFLFPSNLVVSIPLFALSACILYMLIRHYKAEKYAYCVSFIILIILVGSIFYTDLSYIANLAPADQINNQFLDALRWLKNNSASNNVVLTLWPDGSVVEGVANLTSITDSVGSQYGYKGKAFARWLFNSTLDPAFLLSNITGRPDYLVARTAWMYETGGIFIEAELNVNSTNFGYNLFTSLNEKVNATDQLYQFYGSGFEVDVVITNSSGMQTISSYLKFNNGIQPFGYVNFYNINTGEFSVIKQTAFNTTNNQTFLIVYSSVPSPSLYVNITNAYMLNTDLANSNMIKLLYQCGKQACVWDNSVARMQLVYVNPDTKIFRIIYNETNPAVAAVSYPR